MIRRAIIIGNNTGYQAPTYLSGVSRDLVNYKNYLKSNVGGAWLDNEITVIQNGNKRAILAAISTCVASYSFVVFSGHGFMFSRDKLTYICVADGLLSENELNTGLSKQTLILDCCREVEDISEARGMGDVQYLEKGGTVGMYKASRTIDSARQKFDSAISASSAGQCRAYACDVNETSGDNAASGGVFSSALMRVGKNFGAVDNERGYWLSIKSAVQMATTKINSDPFTNQSPTFITIPNNIILTHPFAITNHIQRAW